MVLEEVDGDAPLGESAIEDDKTGAGIVVTNSRGKQDALGKRPGTETDIFFSEQRGQAVTVLVIKIVPTNEGQRLFHYFFNSCTARW